MSYKIGSFNCLNFAMGSSKDLKKFADIIINEDFDIIALQEVKGSNALKRLIGPYSHYFPDYWVGMADDDPGVNDYAFLWNSRRIELAYTNTESSGIRTYMPRIYKQYKVDRKSGQKDLIREPYFARLFPCHNSAPFIELRIINTHIRFSKGAENSDSLGAITMRKNEFDVLTKAIYSKEADKRYGTNRPSYTILLGDYNLNMPSSAAATPYLLESFEIIDGSDSKIITTVQSELTTLKQQGTTENDKLVYFSNNYDHFTYDVTRFSGVVVSCQRINTVENYFNGDYEAHRKDLSDHVPIAMSLNIREG